MEAKNKMIMLFEMSEEVKRYLIDNVGGPRVDSKKCGGVLKFSF